MYFITDKEFAARRQIDFELTFFDWLKIWLESGKLTKRGVHKGGYVMGRFNDEGPYAVGNVSIIPTELNSSEGAKKRVITQNTRDKLRKAQLGKKASPETRKKLSKLLSMRIRKPFSEATKLKIGKARKAAWERLRK